MIPPLPAQLRVSASPTGLWQKVPCPTALLCPTVPPLAGGRGDCGSCSCGVGCLTWLGACRQTKRALCCLLREEGIAPPCPWSSLTWTVPSLSPLLGLLPPPSSLYFNSALPRALPCRLAGCIWAAEVPIQEGRWPPAVLLLGPCSRSSSSQL